MVNPTGSLELLSVPSLIVYTRMGLYVVSGMQQLWLLACFPLSPSLY